MVESYLSASQFRLRSRLSRFLQQVHPSHYIAPWSLARQRLAVVASSGSKLHRAPPLNSVAVEQTGHQLLLLEATACGQHSHLPVHAAVVLRQHSQSTNPEKARWLLMAFATVSIDVNMHHLPLCTAGGRTMLIRQVPGFWPLSFARDG